MLKFLIRLKNWRLKVSEAKIELFFTVLAFLLSFGFIAKYLDLSLLLTNTTVTGGDTGSQIYRLFYMQKIFPLLRWWSPDWYSGYPIMYFYPPLMFWVSTLLGYLIPANIAFKMVIFSGVLIYPVAAYLSLKLLGLKYPIPQLAAVFSLSLMFFEKFTIYGGNLASLLSGQFSHTVSIGLIFIFIGLIYKNVLENKYLVWTVLTGAAIILTHPVSGILLILISPAFIFQGEKIRKSILRVFKIYLGIFLITAFWTFGLVFYKEYSGYMEWGKEIKWDELFPIHLRYLIYAAALSVPLAIIKKEKRLIGLFVLLILTSLGYFFVDKSNIWNNRFLPYVLFCMLIFAAYFYGNVIRAIRKKTIIIAGIATIFLMLFSLVTVKQNMSFTAFWFKWNFEGYEVKPAWPEVNSLFKYLNSLPQGRVMWEFQPDFSKYGTTRVLEAIPFFTDKPTFEGLAVDSALYAPFHFIVQAETTDKPTSAIAGFEYPPFDFAKGVRHMQLTGAQYFIAYTDKIKSDADYSSSLIKLKNTGQFSVYKVTNSSMVEISPTFIIEKKDKDWLKKSIEWFKSDDFKSPIVFAFNNGEIRYLSGLANKSTPVTESSVSNIKSGRDYLEFDTNNIGVPHIIKITYFPTWRVSGAKGPFLVSPSYMMVVPTQNHVRLYFSYGIIDWSGFALTGLGIGYLIYFRRRRQQ
ncbi:MAG: hypothetical protein A2W22_01405 [Candidatus Levybacteria bacterium RBG_16_35_11]|nr:MAG: hypothetical protein A2W22_01405 [Candidatus Levybacteria bacterium RBG_16_35_11]